MPDALVELAMLGALCASCASGAFVPFSGVDELKPQRLRDFCGSEPLPVRAPNIRRCKHHFTKTLDDESEVELGWQIEADPDAILSLDTEAEHGVRLHRCASSSSTACRLLSTAPCWN
mmetsp:Transcript_114216/g.328133  ORF Transcript_114216/g.328133 Transcript_114216/m.328133 type:complete len:118 (+) Transcript_114216:58-411(+)